MEAIAQTPFRLKTRIGAHEFDAEGPEAAVKEQFSLFVQAINSAAPEMPSKSKVISTVVHDDVDAVDDRDGPVDDDAVDAIWNRVYKRDDGKVSLLVLPQTSTPNPDSIILLIYGFQTLLKQEAVNSTDLMDAAKWSGLRIDRIDRNLTNGHASLIVKGGSRKGSRYSLNNRGMTYAQELLEKMFD